MRRFASWSLLLFGGIACQPVVRAEVPTTPTAVPSADEASAGQVASTGQAPLPAFPPRDECGSAPGWESFRTELERAIASRSASALIRLSSPGIELDIGGGSGRAELRKRLADPLRDIWGALDALMPLGCAMHDGQAILPWWFERAPEDEDPYSQVLVFGTNTPLLNAPGGEAIVVAGWQSARIASGPDDGFTRIVLADGQSGWVESDHLRELLDYRVVVERVRGVWRITAIVAGD